MHLVDQGFILQQHNDPKHKSKLYQNYLRKTDRDGELEHMECPVTRSGYWVVFTSYCVIKSVYFLKMWMNDIWCLCFHRNSISSVMKSLWSTWTLLRASFNIEEEEQRDYWLKRRRRMKACLHCLVWTVGFCERRSAFTSCHFVFFFTLLLFQWNWNDKNTIRAGRLTCQPSPPPAQEVLTARIQNRMSLQSCFVQESLTVSDCWLKSADLSGRSCCWRRIINSRINPLTSEIEGTLKSDWLSFVNSCHVKKCELNHPSGNKTGRWLDHADQGS